MIKFLLIAGVILAVVLMVVVGIYLVPMLVVFHGWRQRMLFGRNFMDSLTEADIVVWIAKAEDFIARCREQSADPERAVAIISGADIPAELQELQIIRVDVIGGNDSWPATVNFVWMGGMDHTALMVKRDPSGGHTVIAEYNDYSSRQLWPATEGGGALTASGEASDAI